MRCRDAVQFLLDYLEGELPPPQRAAFQEHLRACPPCRAYLATYSETIRLARDCLCEGETGAASLPRGLVEAIRLSRRGAAREPGSAGDDAREDGAAG